MFEDKSDVDLFLGLTERTVIEGLLEVLAFSVLTSHFHMLVRSPRGQLSAAMQRLESDYCQAFNRARGRDGPLVTGRFFSKRVEDDRYRRIVTGYIDWNPVDAGLSKAPELYPFGSARHYVSADRPRWLSTEWLDDALGAGQRGIDPEVYRAFSRPSKRQCWVVEARLRRGDLPDPEQLLAHGPIQGAAEWFRQRAELADGHAATLPVASPDACVEAVELLLPRLAEIQKVCPRRDLPTQFRVGIVSRLAGVPIGLVAAELGLHLSSAYDHAGRHRRMILEGEDYAVLCGEAARLAIELMASDAGILGTT